MKVYKYRNFNENNINSLTENYFWCASKESLNDPCEGFFTDNKLREELNSFKFLAKLTKSNVNFDNLAKVFEDLKKTLDRLGIFSTSKSPYIHTLWSLYADSHKGFCVEYDLEELVAKDPRLYNRFNVHYLDAPQDLSLNDLGLNQKNSSHELFFQKVIGTKHTDWSNEQEVRITSDELGMNYHRQSAIKAIYFGQKCSEEDKNNLMRKLANRNVVFKEISKSNNSFNLSAIDIINPFDNAKFTKGKLAKIEEFAIYEEGIKEEYKQYIPYLYKVAEIMQKDPDCEVVETIDFSTSSTVENPIIYVNFQEYKKLIPISQKRFTISDIDKLLS